MRKLLLISPSSRLRHEGLGQRKWQATPPLALGYVAALTPPDWEVKIVDEYLEPVDLDEPADLVGMTALTCNAPRAYELAGRFRARGIPVVIGGIHASMCPDEAANYVNTVVVGEAEPVWETVLWDFQRGRLQPRYVAPRIPLDHLPIPRRDLFSSKYRIDLVLTSKGCPFNCSFCNVTTFNGSEYRQRPVDDVLDELDMIRSRILYIVDDNLIGSGTRCRERALCLFKGMASRKHGKVWGCQASLNIGDDPEVLDWAYRGGCRFIFIGIESVSSDSLKEMNKGVNLTRGVNGMISAIRRIQKSRISVSGGFIFGNDHDDIDTFDRTSEFIDRSGLDVAAVSFLTPFPGTPLFERLRSENRLLYDHFPEDWDRYDQSHIVFKPQRCDISELVRATDHVDIHRAGSQLKSMTRFLGTLFRTRNLTSARFAYHLNAGKA